MKAFSVVSLFLCAPPLLYSGLILAACGGPENRRPANRMERVPEIPTAQPWPGPDRIDLTPAWTWLHRDVPSRGYSRARLLEDQVVGLWFCLDRQTGNVVWRGEELRPNHIHAVRDGIIVGTEMLSFGPTTGSYGIYGVELATGRVAWTHHDENQLEAFPSHIKLVESEDSRNRDAPSRMSDEGIVTLKGRVLDLQTGELLRGLTGDEPREGSLQEFRETRGLYYVGALDLPGHGRLFLGTGEAFAEVREHLATPELSGYHSMPTHMGRGEPFGFTFESPTGQRLWQFDFSLDRYWIDGNYYSYREFGRFLFLVYAEPTTDPREWEEWTDDGERLNAPFHAAVLDLTTGEIVSTLRFGDEPANIAQIEALDERGILLSADFGSDRLYIYIDI